VLLLELWTWLGCGLFLIWPNVYVLTAGSLPTALAIPSTNSVVHGYRMAMTPDRLLGRVESIWRTISLLLTPLGPLVAGILLDALAARAAIGLFAAVALVLVVWGNLSPSIRAAPSLDELDRHRG
jgi:MFS family permease